MRWSPPAGRGDDSALAVLICCGSRIIELQRRSVSTEGSDRRAQAGSKQLVAPRLRASRQPQRFLWLLRRNRSSGSAWACWSLAAARRCVVALSAALAWPAALPALTRCALPRCSSDAAGARTARASGRCQAATSRSERCASGRAMSPQQPTHAHCLLPAAAVRSRGRRARHGNSRKRREYALSSRPRSPP